MLLLLSFPKKKKKIISNFFLLYLGILRQNILFLDIYTGKKKILFQAIKQAYIVGCNRTRTQF